MQDGFKRDGGFQEKEDVHRLYITGRSIGIDVLSVVHLNRQDRVILGGTFYIIHKGHKELINTALNLGHVTIGLVSDDFLKRWKPELEAPYRERKKRLEQFLVDKDGWEIVSIDDPYKKAVKGDFDTLVVSWETRKRGEKINEIRKRDGKTSLNIEVIPPVLADDLLPISSTRIREAEIDDEGRRLNPVKVNVGSLNEIKIKVVEEIFSSIFEIEIDKNMPKDLDKQPLGDTTKVQARKRARVPEGFDYAVGIESGVFSESTGPYNMEFAVIRDKTGYETIGRGPGIPLPYSWLEKIESGSTLSNLLSETYQSDQEGTVDAFSDGRIKREDCIRTAVIMALIPRLNRDFFFLDEE